MGNIYNYLNAVFQDLKRENSKHPVFVFVLLSLVCVPMIYAANSISLALLALATLITFGKINTRFDAYLMLPVMMHVLMVLSMIWSIDPDETWRCIFKELPLLIIPLCFMVFPLLSVDQRKKIISYYSHAMVLFSLFYIVRAIIRFFITKDSSVFFYHELVTKDVNAIHVSIYVSVAFFWFFTKPLKTWIDWISGGILLATVFLLSSKNIIVVFVLLIGIFFLFFSHANRKIKIASLAGFVLLIGSLALIPQIRQRFSIESKTVMTDGTQNESYTNAKVYNVSVRQAWNQESFHPNDFFPGTAFRVYQFRIFLEMMQEDNAWLTGYGLNASYPRIEEKTIGYNLFLGFDKNSGYQKKNFHNQYIQNFAELGIFGFLLLVAMLWVNLKTALKRKDFVHISFAILMISLFLTESFLWRQRGVTFFTMMYCLFNSGMAIKKNQNI
jgi:O-antigen ligase